MNPRTRAQRHLRHLKLVVVAASVMPAFGCDPIPEPAVCSDGQPANWAYATATWSATGADGGFAVVFRLTIDSESYSGLAITAPTADGAAITDTTPSGSTTVVTMTPADGVTEVVVHVPFACDGAPTPVDYTIAIDPTLPDGSDLPVTTTVP